LAAARLATATYATNLHAAKADGYQLITRMIPAIWAGTTSTRPSRASTSPSRPSWSTNATAQLAAGRPGVGVPQDPGTPPLPGASYGSFPAACHYRDGTFVAARVQELCANHSPQTGARFTFWHPDLVTLHLWLWYPNPAGLYSGTNPLIRPFNHT
jgi:hypothetical protein